MSPRPHHPARTLLGPLLAIVLLTGMGLSLITRPGAADADAFHAAIRDASIAIPDDLGPWEGADAPIPPAAIKLLKPNIIRTRRYRNRQTSESITLLLAQCRDARDLAGHYPPVCYPAYGWTAGTATARQWQADSRLIDGMAYTFTRDADPGRIDVTIYNFLAMPDGQIVHDMNQVYRAAADHTRRHYGAAQLQMVFPAGISEARRDAIFIAFLNELAPLIDAITAGTPADPTESK